MFDNENFTVYEFTDIPLNRDCFLMGEQYIQEYEQEFLKFFSENGVDHPNIGYISYIAVRNINEASLELSWYPNVNDRFHEVSITLPKEELIICVDCWNYDEKPHLFVKDNWLKKLHLKHYSSFAMIDAIGVKNAIQRGLLSKNKLANLRSTIDKLASEYPEISFVSFADSVLLKTNWTVGHYQSDIIYTYHPELLVHIFQKLKSIYSNCLGLNIYGVFTQGSNEYYDEGLLHISSSQNHICLNSLGVPFADLLAIDETARRYIKERIHPPCELYMDSHFYHSLNFNFGFDKHQTPKQHYPTKIKANGSYYYCQSSTILENLHEKHTSETK